LTISRPARACATGAEQKQAEPVADRVWNAVEHASLSPLGQRLRAAAGGLLGVVERDRHDREARMALADGAGGEAGGRERERAAEVRQQPPRRAPGMDVSRRRAARGAEHHDLRPLPLGERANSLSGRR